LDTSPTRFVCTSQPTCDQVTTGLAGELLPAVTNAPLTANAPLQCPAGFARRAPRAVAARSTIPSARAFALFNLMFLQMFLQLCLRLHDQAQQDGPARYHTHRLCGDRDARNLAPAQMASG
jgi:hypothetical protein